MGADKWAHTHTLTRIPTKLTEALPRLVTGDLRVVQILHGAQPPPQVLFRIHDQTEAVVLRVQTDDELVLGVAPLVNVKAALQHDRALWHAELVPELALVLEVVQPRRLIVALAEQHKVAPLVRLQLLQCALQHDELVAGGRRRGDSGVAVDCGAATATAAAVGHCSRCVGQHVFAFCGGKVFGC